MLEAGTGARPTQPPHPPLIVDVPSGYPKDLGTFGTPDTVDITDVLSVDVTPLTSTTISGMDVPSCPDMSVAKSVDLGASVSVDFMIGLEKFKIPLLRHQRLPLPQAPIRISEILHKYTLR